MGPGLTTGSRRTSFSLLRGHLSRPACSHVKQLAKQAGDRCDPGRTFVQAGFFYGLISGVVFQKNRLREVGSKMVNVQSIPSPAIHPHDRPHAPDPPPPTPPP